MKTRFDNLSLKYKATMVTFFVALIPLVVLGICIFMVYSNAFEERSRMHINENIRIMTSRINGVFVDANLCTNHILLNMNQIESENIKQEITKDNRINNLLNQSLLIFEGIESIVYITPNDRMYSTNIDLLTSNRDEIINSSYKEMLLDANGKTKLFDKVEDCMTVNDPVVTMGKRVTNIITGETLGYLFVNISSEYLVQSVQNRISHYLVYDNLGNSIIEYEEGHFLEDAKLREELYTNSEVSEYRYKGEKYLFARSEITEYGWNVIGVTNLNKYNVDMQKIMQIVILIGFLIAILMGTMIYAATTLITKPLLKLKKGAEEIATGNLNVHFNFHTQDEIGKLGNIFNIMTLKIRELLKRVDEEARKKREYELALLHEQIKPHFLYNTLDIIIVLIEMKREWEAAHVVKKLAAYYKNSLSSSEEIISLETEIQIIEDYLELQNIRYGGKFSYDIVIDAEAKKECIPRLTLQPLVENAIYHGLKYKENWGTIRVYVHYLGEKIQIKVMDDGIGIPDEKLNEIRSFAEKVEKHFGLYSVHHRLLLYYGEEVLFNINSKYEEGTCITIEVPRGNRFDKDYDRR
ncbi:MAG: histidine kinase [Agathobacter sp.]|nr:histidine kinase [Agathobacter sp.]